jgi:hypothetical protein
MSFDTDGFFSPTLERFRVSVREVPSYKRLWCNLTNSVVNSDFCSALGAIVYWFDCTIPLHITLYLGPREGALKLHQNHSIDLVGPAVTHLGCLFGHW